MRILRGAGAVVAGFVTACIVMMVFESFNGRVLYPEMAKAAEGVTDREVIRGILASAPAGAFLAVLAGWLSGGIAGGWVAARVAGQSGLLHGLLLGLLLTLAGIANNLMLPPPFWFWVVSVLVLLPSACLGARLAGRG